MNVRPNSPSAQWIWLPALLGVIAFFFVTGGKILDPRYIDWLMEGDPAQHWLGWQFFRSSPLIQWPLGANPGYGMELGSSIVFTDSIPLMAFIFKVLNPLLPEKFQYFGIWILICFALQTTLAWMLLSRFTRDRVLLTLGSLFFTLAPVCLWRLHGHYALFGQWVLVAALYLYFLDRFSLRRWAPLLIAVVLIHAYLTVLVLAVLLTDIVSRRWHGQMTTVKAAAMLLAGLAITGLTMWTAGYFMIGSGVSSHGFGLYRMNLLSLIDPNVTGGEPYGSWSLFIPDLPGLTGDYEGYNYLGSGMIALALIALYTFWRTRKTPIDVKRVVALAALSLVLFIYALSNNVALGNHELFSYPLPDFALSLAETFRASGRFFWPVYYVIYTAILCVLLTRVKKPLAIALCLAALLFQVVDSRYVWSYFHHKFTNTDTWDSPLDASLWQTLSKRYQSIKVIRPSNGPENWLEISQFAATHHMATNAAYLARVDPTVESRNADELADAVAHQSYQPDTLYVFNDDALWSQATQHLRPQDVAGVLNGLRILAPGLGECTQCDLSELVSVAQSTRPAYSSGTFMFNTQGNGLKYQVSGWATPEDIGTWSLDDTAVVTLPMSALPDRKLALKIDGMAFLSLNHVAQKVTVKANGVPLKTLSYDLDRFGPRVINLPRDFKLGPDNTLTITLGLKDAVSPLALGISPDTRRLGLNLKSIEVISVN